MTGTIKRLTDKGYGFIDNGTGRDVFFHAAELVGVDFNELREGDALIFEVSDSPKGPQATGISRG